MSKLNKKKFILSASTVFLLVNSLSAYAQQYRVPPTSSTYGHVPVISDDKMEECIKLYNEAEWLSDKLSSMHVDQYNSDSVDNYNRQVNVHTNMIRRFNSECAGKQSRSAYEAAQRLNTH
ncbi:hypothetical protein [Vibrio sp. WZ-1]|uniref:hypothetical protein n=1 Tax=Vibrio sp. WZ-1 TaxID=3454501 RepID=UPI003F835257